MLLANIDYTVDSVVIQLTFQGCEIFVTSLITGAQPKAGNGHKMQSVPVVFDRRIVRDISLTFFWECSLAH